MQNKYQKKFSCWCPKLGDSQLWGRGVQAGWDKIPSFAEIFFGRLPLRRNSQLTYFGHIFRVYCNTAIIFKYFAMCHFTVYNAGAHMTNWHGGLKELKLNLKKEVFWFFGEVPILRLFCQDTVPAMAISAQPSTPRVSGVNRESCWGKNFWK